MSMMYGEYIDILGMDRIEAIILVGDKFYENGNHQYAVLDYKADFYFEHGHDLSWDNIDQDSLIDQASLVTDKAFREQEMVGLDLYEGDENKMYLLSHYPQAFNDPNILRLCREYADKHGYLLGTFTDEDMLSKEARLLVFE